MVAGEATVSLPLWNFPAIERIENCTLDRHSANTRPQVSTTAAVSISSSEGLRHRVGGYRCVHTTNTTEMQMMGKHVFSYS